MADLLKSVKSALFGGPSKKTKKVVVGGAAPNGEGMAHESDPEIRDDIPVRPPRAPGAQPRRPRRIILMRHGQSVGNVDDQIYSTTPDWKVPLTAKGCGQAAAAGKSFRAILDGDAAPGPVFIYTSPYKRCQETVDHLLLGADLPQSRILGRREEPRIREQDFGNFQDPQKVRECKVSRDEFGRFFYRFPNGESGADVYDRVSTWLETMCATRASLFFFLFLSSAPRTGTGRWSTGRSRTTRRSCCARTA